MMRGYLTRSVRAALVVSAALALVLACCTKNKEGANETSARQSEKTPNVTITNYPVAPDVELRAIDGSSVRLSSFPGKVIVLTFLATWSEDCQRQVSALNELQARLQRFEFAVLGVVTDDEGIGALMIFKQKYPINFPIYYNGKEVAARFGGIPTLPTTYLILRDGKSIFLKTRGYHSMYELDEMVKRIIAHHL